jgi:hypothetical protein
MIAKLRPSRRRWAARALKGDPTLEAEVASTLLHQKNSSSRTRKLKRGHGRIEMRTYTASSNADWIISTRSYPDEPRFTNIRTLVKVFSRVEYAIVARSRRASISHRPLSISTGSLTERAVTGASRACTG